jgi:hypothetical protein
MAPLPFTVELTDAVTGEFLWGLCFRQQVSVPWPNPAQLGCDQVNVRVTFADGTIAETRLQGRPRDGGAGGGPVCPSLN